MLDNAEALAIARRIASAALTASSPQRSVVANWKNFTVRTH